MTDLQVWTVGHSTQPIDDFTALLERHKITAVADVRSSPHSRYSPQFNRAPLLQQLKRCGIKYVFLGRELGARSDDASCYERGRVQYSRLAETALFRSGIERVIRGAAEQRIALMCAEREPLECHRTVLVARVLAERGVSVEHILSNGQVERQSDTLRRLLGIVGLPHRDLFRSTEDLIREALARQEERIAYTDDSQAAKAEGVPL